MFKPEDDVGSWLLDPERVPLPFERRTQPRTPRSLLVHYAIPGCDGIPLYAGMGATVDVSMGGLKLYLAREIRVDSIIDIDLAIGEGLLSVRGQVVRLASVDSERYLVGIRIVDVLGGDVESFAAAVDKAS